MHPLPRSVLLALGLATAAGADTGDTGDTGDSGDVDFDLDGVTVAEGDCNDNSPLMYPGNEEVEDGLDNDCDGEVDEGFTSQACLSVQACLCGCDVDPTPASAALLLPVFALATTRRRRDVVEELAERGALPADVLERLDRD